MEPRAATTAGVVVMSAALLRPERAEGVGAERLRLHDPPQRLALVPLLARYQGQALGRATFLVDQPVSKADRRARKRERKNRGEDEAYWEAMAAYMRSRIVCDRCGLEQPFAYGGDDGELASCLGPLGVPCDSETATWLDDDSLRCAAT